jgi:hypothetical protein
MKSFSQPKTPIQWVRRGCAKGAFLVVVLLLNAGVQAQDFSYTITSGTITITGYTGPGGAVIIPSTIGSLPVTSIGERAFGWSTILTSVTIPNGISSIEGEAFINCSLTTVTIGSSVTNIGEQAFAGCTSLTSVTIPKNVMSISTEAFRFCTRLTSLTIGNGVTNIGDSAFESCSSLPGVTIPDSVTSIGDYAFHYCSNLASVAIGNGVKIIGAQAFADCTSLSSVAIPDSVSTITDGMNGWWAEGVFSSCTSLTNVAIGRGVTNIGDNAFFGCANLAVVTMPGNVGRIGFHAFMGCTSLASVSIPGSVTNIANDYSFLAPYAGTPFSDCTSLTAITVDPLNPVYSSLDGVLFNKDRTTLLAYPGGKTVSYTIPGTVTNVESRAFQGCAGLTSVVVADSVTRIGSHAFSGCRHLTGVTLGGGVTSLEEYAFRDCVSLQSISIPESVTSIGDAAFFGCASLPSIVIGKSLTSIGAGAFSYCTGLGAITVDPLNPSYSSVDGVLFDKGQATLIQFPPGKGGGYEVPGKVASIERGAFDFCTNLTSVTIGNDVTNIGYFAFCSCTGLERVTIGAGVQSIGEIAFLQCTALKGVYFQGNAPSLGLDVFAFDTNSVIYYLPQATGWGPMFGGRPTAQWNPQIRTHDTNFGVRPNGFRFSIAGTTDIPLVIEASTDVSGQSWVPLQTCTLTNGLIYFSDPQWTNYPGRFYRIRSP